MSAEYCTSATRCCPVARKQLVWRVFVFLNIYCKKASKLCQAFVWRIIHQRAANKHRIIEKHVQNSSNPAPVNKHESPWQDRDKSFAVFLTYVQKLKVNSRRQSQDTVWQKEGSCHMAQSPKSGMSS